MNINKFVSPEIIFGPGALDQVGECARRLGATQVFLVSDPGVVAAGWAEKTGASIREAGLGYVTWAEITPNPKDVEVEAGVEAYLGSGCDAVVAIGGGSAIDAAKAVAIVATNGSPIHDYEGVDRIKFPLPPMVTVPSTAGSGSEVSQFSMIVDSRRQVKMTIVSKSLVPDICVADPLLLATVGNRLTAYTGLEALTHAIEAYISLAATGFTDVHALAAIRLLAVHLPAAVANRGNREAKTALAQASLHAGLAFSNAILGLVHAIAHQLGGLLDIPQGEANSLLLPHVLRFNLIAAIDKYIKIAEALGENITGHSRMAAAQKAVEAVEDLCLRVGVKPSLSGLGITKEHVGQLACNAVNDACIVTNPRDVTKEDIEGILLSALANE